MLIACAGCDKPILDKFLLNVLERTWHADCVRCFDCHAPLTDKCFSREGKLFCRNDFFRRYGTKCGGCGQGISPSDLKATVDRRGALRFGRQQVHLQGRLPGGQQERHVARSASRSAARLGLRRRRGRRQQHHVVRSQTSHHARVADAVDGRRDEQQLVAVARRLGRRPRRRNKDRPGRFRRSNVAGRRSGDARLADGEQESGRQRRGFEASRTSHHHQGETARDPEDGVLADTETDQAHTRTARQGDGPADARDPSVVSKQTFERAPPQAANVDGPRPVLRIVAQDARIPDEPLAGRPRGRSARVSLLRHRRRQVRVRLRRSAVPPARESLFPRPPPAGRPGSTDVVRATDGAWRSDGRRFRRDGGRRRSVYDAAGRTRSGTRADDAGWRRWGCPARRQSRIHVARQLLRQSRPDQRGPGVVAREGLGQARQRIAYPRGRPRKRRRFESCPNAARSRNQDWS